MPGILGFNLSCAAPPLGVNTRGPGHLPHVAKQVINHEKSLPAGIFLLSGCDHMITFFHVIISLLPGLGNTAAGRLRHPGGDWQGGSRDEGGDQNSKISLSI